MTAPQVNRVYYSLNSVPTISEEKDIKNFSSVPQIDNGASDTVSFKGKSDTAKRGWLLFRKLSNYMKESSEMTNALIASIGTGVIAPVAIMCSPSKKSNDSSDKQADKDKKFFQAMRQPISAALQFGFQIPTTILIAKGLNNMAYEKHLKLFDDEILGELIPDKAWLKKEAKKVLDGKADYLTQKEWSEEIKTLPDKNTLKKELIAQLKRDYEEVGIKIADDKLERMANDKNKMLKFISEKLADAKHTQLLTKKIEYLKDKNIEIKDLDLITENYQDLAKQRFKDDFAKLKDENKLSWGNKLLKTIGFSNKKINEVSNKEKELAKEKGMELMRDDMPEIFSDKDSRLKKYIENRNINAQKLYKNKIFWLTLGTNIVMVAMSCVALNWLHPKFANLINKGKNKSDTSQNEKKVEVRA